MRRRLPGENFGHGYDDDQRQGVSPHNCHGRGKVYWLRELRHHVSRLGDYS